MNMIERVARAINNALEAYSGTDGEELMRQAALTTIQAMRDPTPEMIEAGEAVDGTVTALPIWQAMIDAIIPRDNTGNPCNKAE